MKKLQFIYFNNVAWYGARLAHMILTDNPDKKFLYHLIPAEHSFPARTDEAVLFSILTPREFEKIYEVLDHLRLPYLSKDRTTDMPLIIAGGSAMFQPEPIADLIDVICVGDGEEFLTGIDQALSLNTKDARLQALSELPGAYIPAWRTPVYDETGFFIKDFTGKEAGKIIIPNVTERWENAPPAWISIARNLELARGCNNTCFFCALTWRNPFRERPLEQAMEIKEDNPDIIAFYAPNLGSVSYFKEIIDPSFYDVSGITVRDYLKLPKPEENEYQGKICFMFGIEGVSERLRHLVGKPIEWEKIRQIQTYAFRGKLRRQRLLFIRNIPSENENDWQELLDFINEFEPQWQSNQLATDIVFTPLTKCAHTPLQFFEATYNRDTETLIKEISTIPGKRKKEKGINYLYIHMSRFEATDALETASNMCGRNYKKVLFAQSKGKFGTDPAAGYQVKMAMKSLGIDYNIVSGIISLDQVDRLPFSHIQPKGSAGRDKLLKAARSIERRLND